MGRRRSDRADSRSFAKQKPVTEATTTQTERAYSALKQGILRGEIREGVFLSDPEMTKRYNIGRTPFREACNRLHHDGLLEVVPRRGYLVPELSFHAVRDLFEARLVLESAIAELAAVRATPSDLENLERLTKLATRKPAPDPSETIEINNEFHLTLARATQNRELVKILSGILDQMQRLMHLELRTTRLQKTDAMALHPPLLAAIQRRDPAAARKAVVNDITEAQSSTFMRSPAAGANGSSDKD